MGKVTSLVFIYLCSIVIQAAASWPQFRGPNASGVSETAKPPMKFGPDENVLWKIELPGSPSSPCIWEDHLFLTTFADRKLQVRAYQRSDGKLLWSKNIEAEKLEEFHQTEGSPAASTPATDGEHVVSYFGSAGLVCHDFSGKEIWRHPLPIAVTAGGFGSGTSPIIVGDRVILNRDQAVNSSLIAFDLKNGEKIWETARPSAPTSYGTPVVWTDGARRDIIVAGSLAMRGYDVTNGSERWAVRGLPSYTVTTPVVGKDMIYFCGWSPGKADSPWPKWQSIVEKDDKNGDGKLSPEEFSWGPTWFRSQDIDGDGFITAKDWETISTLMSKGENVLLAVKPGGTGDVTDSNVAWKYTKGLPYVPSALYYNGRVYMIKDGGMISSLDAATGHPAYAQERLEAQGSYYASPVAADGRVFLTSLDGKITVVKAGGDKPEILHQANFGERITGTMALVEDKIYLRTQTKLYALGTKDPKVAAR